MLAEHLDISFEKKTEAVDRGDFFNCIGDSNVVAAQRRVAQYGMNQYTKQIIINDFLSPGVADPWIVAYALAFGETVVTQERSRSATRKVSLIDVCDRFGIRHIDVFEFLRAEKATFVYQKQGKE